MRRRTPTRRSQRERGGNGEEQRAVTRAPLLRGLCEPTAPSVASCGRGHEAALCLSLGLMERRFAIALSRPSEHYLPLGPGIRLIIVMVLLIKLRSAVDRHFPTSFFPLFCQAFVANKWFSWFAVRFRTFLGLQNLTKFYQFLPNFTKNVQRKGSNRHLKGVFSRPILLKRVNSGG